jgi:hypothetical protein
LEAPVISSNRLIENRILLKERLLTKKMTLNINGMVLNPKVEYAMR